MFLDKLLNKIPFFRNRRLKRIKKDLISIKGDFTDGQFNPEYISSLHNILNSSLIDFSEDIINGSVDTITVHSNTSLGALKLIKKGDTKLTSLQRTPLLGIVSKTIFFSEWYSSEDSITEFIDIMKDHIEADVYMAKAIAGKQTDDAAELIGRFNIEIFDSLLYRLLLIDLVNLITFYLESKYDR